MAKELGPPDPALVQTRLHLWGLLPVIRLLMGFVFLILGPLRVTGKRNVPKKGGLLILANHLSLVDPIAIQLGCPRPMYFMGMSELWKEPSIAWALKIAKAIPVDRGEPDRKALRTTAQLIAAGNAVCVFPEGQLSETQELLELKAGVALIARMAPCKVICCRLTNTNRVMPYGKRFARFSFRAVRVDWSEVRSFEDSTDGMLEWARERLLP